MSDTGSKYLATPALIVRIAAKCIARSLLWRILPCEATRSRDDAEQADEDRECGEKGAIGSRKFGSV